MFNNNGLRYYIFFVMVIVGAMLALTGCDSKEKDSALKSDATNNNVISSSVKPTRNVTDEPIATSMPTQEPEKEYNKLISFSLRTEDNPHLNESLTWEIKENTASININYLLADEDLENVTPYIETTEGNMLLESVNIWEDYTLNLENKDGTLNTYIITTKRQTNKIPVFYIEIENDKEVKSREEYLNATIRIDSSNAVGGFPSMEETDVLIRGRGHYTWKFDKTPYKLRFETKKSVLGLNASKNWVMLANYVDRSLIQNHLAMELASTLTNIPYHTKQIPVDVFVNGTYRGVYTFGEQLEAKKERMDLEYNPSEVDIDYLLEVGGRDDEDVYGVSYFNVGELRNMVIKHPERKSTAKNKITAEQKSYILNYLEETNKAITTLTDYEKYIDVDSFVDWLIITELSYNLDCCYRRSCYLIKEKGGLLKMGPVWDFDLAFGSYFRYSTNNWATIGSEDGYVKVTWMNYLLKDDSFKAKVKSRWNSIKNELLDKAMCTIDNAESIVSPSAEYNFKVWNILGKSVPSQPESQTKYKTYGEYVGRLKNFVRNRYNWMDEQINSF